MLQMFILGLGPRVLRGLRGQRFWDWILGFTLAKVEWLEAWGANPGQQPKEIRTSNLMHAASTFY